MADYGINWSLAASQPNAFMRSFAIGQQIGDMARQRADERDRRNALAGALNGDGGAMDRLTTLDPNLGFRVADRQREQQARDATARVFGGGGRNALLGPVANQAPAPQVAQAMQSNAPADLVDPDSLPPRTDGLTINRDALRQLYAIDPERAVLIQRAVYDADEASFKQMQARGAAMASAAWHLKSVPAEARPQELERIAPLLVRSGIPAEMVQQASGDLSDTALDGFIATGRSIKDILVDDRQERRFAWDMQDDEADNARQDRNTESMISDRDARRALTERGQNLAHSDRRYATDTADRRGRDIAAQTDKRTRESWKVPKVRRGAGGPPTIKSKAEYDALPSGAVYVAPDGTTKRKG